MDTIETRSPVEGRDRDDVLALLGRIRHRTGIDPMSEHKVIGLKHGRAGSTGVLLRSDGELEAYAHLETVDDGFACEVIASSPSPSSRRDAIATSLLGAVKATVAEQGGGTLSYFLIDPSNQDLALANALGFAPRRELLLLSRRNSTDDVLTVEGPPLAPFRVGVDEDAWISLNGRAFSGHPEQGRWSRSDLVDREAEPWFSPDGLLCCWIDGRLAGTCWTKVHVGPEPVGEIYVMSIDPDFQGKGLGRRILSHALAHISAAGLPATILYVEGDNVPALGLYRAFGFENASRTVVLATEVGGE
ncbi:MAG TPA: mycothiol synthase [Acidimicrobiales bacterium]|jgi:mycothiol synthase|nr:mycothiol synthase [Acidimicrobiales bacterium]